MSDTLDGMLEAVSHVEGYTYRRGGKLIVVPDYTRLFTAVRDVVNPNTPTREARLPNGVTVRNSGAGDRRGEQVISIHLPDGGHGGRFTVPGPDKSYATEQRTLQSIKDKAQALDDRVGRKSASSRVEGAPRRKAAGGREG